MMMMGRYAAFLTALLSALFLVFQQQMSSYSNSNVFVAATARLPAASLSNPAIATDGGPRDFTAKARKAWVAATEKSSSVEEVAQLGAGGNYFVHSSVRRRFRGCSCSCSCSVSFVLLSARVFKRCPREFDTLDTFLCPAASSASFAKHRDFLSTTTIRIYIYIYIY